jgi:hypothetical protein
MKVGVTTWDEAGDLGDRVLFVVNSRDDDRAEVDAAFDRVRLSCPADPFVVAPVSWIDWTRRKGLPDARVLVARDMHGDHVDVNGFLVGAVAFRWIQPKGVRVIVGSSPHALHNDEIKDVFERSVTLLLRDGVFLAHTLPSPYIYVFDVPHLLRRMSRSVKIDAYRSTTRALIDGWYRMWKASGSPAGSTGTGAATADVLAIARAHLGDAALDGREESPLPLTHVDELRAVGGYITALHEVIVARDAAFAERSEAVVVRDAIIAELRATLESMPTYRLRRWLGRVAGPTSTSLR